MGTINIAEFDRQISFQKLSLTPNGVGGFIETYTDGIQKYLLTDDGKFILTDDNKKITVLVEGVKKIWARRRQLSSRKATLYGLTELTKSFEYQVRKLAVMPDDTDLINDRGTALRIVGIEEMEDGKTFQKIIANMKV
jgi:hypothetical protein